MIQVTGWQRISAEERLLLTKSIVFTQMTNLIKECPGSTLQASQKAKHLINKYIAE
jgi:hypothetical protein